MKETVKQETTDRIISLYEEIEGTAKKTFDLWCQAGDLLLQVKESLPHGEFEKWINEHLPFKPRQARNYMTIAQNRKEIEEKAESISELTMNQILSLLKPEPETPIDNEPRVEDEAETEEKNQEEESEEKEIETEDSTSNPESEEQEQAEDSNEEEKSTYKGWEETEPPPYTNQEALDEIRQTAELLLEYVNSKNADDFEIRLQAPDLMYNSPVYEGIDKKTAVKAIMVGLRALYRTMDSSDSSIFDFLSNDEFDDLDSHIYQFNGSFNYLRYRRNNQEEEQAS